MLVKITPIGTIFTDVRDTILFKNIVFDSMFLSNCVKTSNALGIFAEEGLYKNDTFKGVYLFDTYSLLKAKEDEPIAKVYVLKSLPTETDFNELTDGKTWAGKLVSNSIGFSKGDWKRFSNSKYCCDVKFYSQNFGVYSEAGIKTKTQKRGWTGIWHKVESDEIICGYDRLILNEKWPSKLFPSIDFVKKSMQATVMSGFSFYDFGYSQQKIGDQVLTTRNILGYDINITNKDVSKALWTVLEPAWKWGNKSFGSGTNQKVAVRTLKDDLINSRIETFDKSIKTTNDDKLTYIFGNDFGFIISAGYGQNGVNLKGIEGVAAKFSYDKGTVLYGCARRGSEWRGVKLIFE